MLAYVDNNNFIFCLDECKLRKIRLLIFAELISNTQIETFNTSEHLLACYINTL